MKTTQTISLLAIALCIGFFTARWSQAQSTTNSSITKPTTNDDIYIQELESLENYLHDTHQTNALNQLFHVLANDRAMRDAIDVKLTTAILQGLRDGKTNEMLNFFENRLDEQIGSFGSEYGALPISYQKQINLRFLQQARDYRVKYPIKNPDQFWGTEMTNAFRILDEKN